MSDVPSQQIASHNMSEDARSSDGRRRKTWLSPASGGLILFLDNIFFGANFSTGMIMTPLICSLAFLTTGMGVFFIQRFRERDSLAASGLKAFVSAVIAGIPTAIAGTILGTIVLLSSGLHALQRGSRSRDVK